MSGDSQGDRDRKKGATPQDVQILTRAGKGKHAQAALEKLKGSLLQKLHEEPKTMTSKENENEQQSSAMSIASNAQGLEVIAALIEQQNDILFSRLDKKLTEEISELKSHFDKTLEEKFKQVMDYVDKEVEGLTLRMNEMDTRITTIEQSQHKAEEFHCDTTIVAENVPFEEGENLIKKMSDLVRRDLAVHVPIVQVLRMKEGPPRKTRYGTVKKPGLVKMQMRSVEDKVAVLREKRNLKNSREFSHVFLRSSKPHAERMMESNMKVLLEMIPGANDYIMTGNGRLVKKTFNRYTGANTRRDGPTEENRDAAGAQQNSQ